MARIKRNRQDVLASGNYYPLRKDFIKVLGLRGTAAILFTVIYSYSLNDDLQGSFYGSQKQLAEEIGATTVSVRKHLNKMISDGLIEKNLISRDGQYTYTYRVDVSKIEERITDLIEERFGSLA